MNSFSETTPKHFMQKSKNIFYGLVNFANDLLFYFKIFILVQYDEYERESSVGKKSVGIYLLVGNKSCCCCFIELMYASLMTIIIINRYFLCVCLLCNSKRDCDMNDLAK